MEGTAKRGDPLWDAVEEDEECDRRGDTATKAVDDSVELDEGKKKKKEGEAHEEGEEEEEEQDDDDDVCAPVANSESWGNEAELQLHIVYSSTFRVPVMYFQPCLSGKASFSSTVCLFFLLLPSIFFFLCLFY